MLKLPQQQPDLAYDSLNNCGLHPRTTSKLALFSFSRRFIRNPMTYLVSKPSHIPDGLLGH